MRRGEGTGVAGVGFAATPDVGLTVALAPSVHSTASQRAQPASGLGTQVWHYGGTLLSLCTGVAGGAGQLCRAVEASASFPVISSPGRGAPFQALLH